MGYRDNGFTLTSGLGGGLDVLNAALFWLAARNAGTLPVLGSVQSVPMTALGQDLPPFVSGVMIGPDDRIDHVTESGLSRFAEPALSRILRRDVLLLSRRPLGTPSPVDGPRLRKSIEEFRRIRPGMLLFVDGGGDSLVLRPSDATEDSEHTDPFAGGDSEVLEALSSLGGAVLAVVAAGLDIDPAAFESNCRLLEERGAWYGTLDLLTGEREGDTFEDVLDFGPKTLASFLDIAERILPLDESEVGLPGKTQSMTATVTYRALRREFGRCRTWLPWEPTGKDGSRGPVVRPEHARVHFLDAGAIHGLKLDLNGGNRPSIPLG